MGTWSLLSVNAQVTPFDTGELFGNNVKAVFKLKYTSATIGSWAETPMLSWHEKIMMNEHHKGETWVFETNMYAHNPNSKTLEIWPQRYIAAYQNAHNQARMGKGYCKLLDKNGQIVAGAKLGTHTTNLAKAEAVRKYLKSNSGILEIEVHDIPSINIPSGADPSHKERLLLFNCGVVGSGVTFKAYQYLNVDSSQPKTSWGRDAGLSWAKTELDTTGLKVVSPPQMVSMQRAANFMQGEFK